MPYNGLIVSPAPASLISRPWESDHITDPHDNTTQPIINIYCKIGLSSMKLRKQNCSTRTEISVDNFGLWPGKLSQREDLTTVQTSNWDKLVFPAPGWLIPLRTNVAVGILIANHKITVYTHPPTSPSVAIWPRLSIRSKPDIGMLEVETEMVRKWSRPQL